MAATDSSMKIEAALRGARIAKSALQLMDAGTDALMVRLVTQELSEQLFELREFSVKCSQGKAR